MNVRKIIAMLSVLTLALLLIFTIPGCSSSGSSKDNSSDSSSSDSSSSSQSTSESDGETDDEVDVTTITVDYDNDDLDSSTSSIDMSTITLAGDSVSFSGSGATVDGSTVTITAAGVYSISGTLNDGQIIVDTQDEETVKLVLNGADITCSSSAPIYVANAEKTVITLADGTDNFVTDGTSYTYDEASADEPNAAIFSKDDLTINGSGSLEVDANYNNGIASKDDLKITGGTISVNAVNDGLKGRDSVAIKDGNITINANGDGIQSNNDEDSEKGFVYIEGGTINITANNDGIQAETSIIITDGTISISSGGGSSKTVSYSAKGIKAEAAIAISGGIINLDSSDDSIHSNGSLTIDGGQIVSATGDDGIHSDSTLVINGGEINITKCYEGLESAVITINAGTIHIVSSDDGVNASSGGGGDTFGGGPGQNSSNSNNYLYINGGYIAIDSLGDGLDSNGSAYMTDGMVIVNGPTGNNNGALDCNIKITGGFLVAVGSSGMAESPITSSTQDYIKLTFGSQQAAGTIFHLESEDGEEVITFAPSKTFQSVVVCTPELEEGSNYVFYWGGSSTGTATDGLYSGGTYTPSSNSYSFTLDYS